MLKRKGTKGDRLLYRLIAVWCVAVFFVSAAVPSAVAGNKQESSETFSEKTKQYEIAVVFDNSLSMFWDDDYIVRWSRAKFAMEIFASMLNFEAGDTLTIFPMWKVTTDGNKPAVSGGSQPADYLAEAKDQVKISSRGDIDKITKMFTIHADDTPFDAVENAVGFLKSAKNSGKEQWLIILTDGEFDMRHGQELDKNGFDVKKEIDALKPENIHIQYLAIDPKDDNNQIPQGDDNMFFVDTAVGDAIQQKLIDICNRIFERNQLPDSAIDGAQLTLDLSMKKVIVFIQGEGVEIRGLKGTGGKDVNKVMDSQQRRFSDFSMGHARDTIKIALDKIQADRTLYGQVVTFDSCPAGAYTLDISGYDAAKDKLQVFYSPDVRVETHLISQETGEEIKADEEDVYPGEYTVKSTIVDQQTQQDVTDSPLLGNDLDYTITVTNGDESYEIGNGDMITLNEGPSKIRVEVSYLNGKYTITNTDSPLFKGIEIKLPHLSALKLKCNCKQPNSWYQLTKTEEWQPVRVDVTLGEEKLTDEQMQALKISYDVNDGAVVLSHRLLPGESAFEIDIGKDADGKFTAPPEMIASLKVQAATTDEYERELSDSASCHIEVHQHSVFWRYIVGGSIAAGLIALVLWFMSRKVLPKEVRATQQIFRTSEAMMEGQGKAQLDRKAKKIKVASPPADEPMNCRISFEVVPESRRWTPSKERKYRISRIFGPASTVNRVEINSIGYVKDEKGAFVSEDNPEAPLKIAPHKSYNVVIFAEEAQLECRVTNK